MNVLVELLDDELGDEEVGQDEEEEGSVPSSSDSSEDGARKMPKATGSR